MPSFISNCILYIRNNKKEEGLTGYPSLLSEVRTNLFLLLSPLLFYIDSSDGRAIERKVDIHRHSFQICSHIFFVIVIKKMDNVVLTSATQISPDSGTIISSQTFPLATSELPTVEALLGNPLEPVGQTNIDGNFQARHGC